MIGGGQAGLPSAITWRAPELRFVILDAHERVGDSWRKRWDSLRLFTPAKFDGLDGMPFPAPANYFPTKDEMADYLEATRALSTARAQWCARRAAVQARRPLCRRGAARAILRPSRLWSRWPITSSPGPRLRRELCHGLVQMHSSDYRNLSQLKPGGVLLVGAGNSGAELAMEAARGPATDVDGGPEHGGDSVPTGEVSRAQPDRSRSCSASSSIGS